MLALACLIALPFADPSEAIAGLQTPRNAGGAIGVSDAEPQVLALTGDLERIHDPVIMKEGETYYVFSTNGRPGALIPIRCSTDLRQWTLCGRVFEQLPDWAKQEIPGATAPWAPDISFFNGRYHLYYAVSTFGKNESAIGLATNETLDSKSPKYKWVDQGLVIRSRKEDDWNAIDPNIVVVDNRQVWLNWGSFWGGIKMRRIDPATGKPAPEDTRLYSLAMRPRTAPEQGSVEAPFIVRHGGHWYLFVSFDFCCRGAKSTYNVVVGRSANVTGPYVDRAGKLMMEGGGTPLVSSATGKWRGPGHQAVLQDRSGDYLVFHAYSAETGRSSLQISTLVWKDGWPLAGALP